MKKMLSLTLALTMALGAVPSIAYASSYPDVQGHWGETAITYWSQYGVVGGRENGLFDPDGYMTRAEFAQVMVNLLQLEDSADIGKYIDVSASDWYASAMAKCVAAGILSGTSDYTLSPKKNISREEMFVMLARAFGLEPEEESNTVFNDSDQISEWAVGYANAIVNRGWVGGMGDNMLMPKANVTRASVLQMLMNSINQYSDDTDATIEATEGSVVLAVAKDTVVTGKAATVIVYADTTIEGEVDEIIVMAPDVTVTIAGKVDKMTISESADGAEVSVDEEGSVSDVLSYANNIQVRGRGIVDSVQVFGNDTVVTTEGTEVTVAEDATGTVAGETEVEGGETAVVEEDKHSSGSSSSGSSSGGSSSDDSDDDSPAVYQVTFDYGDSTSTKRVESGDAVAAPEDPEKEGYTFAGWYKGDVLYDFSTPVKGSFTLTAKWVANPDGSEEPATVFVGDQGYVTLVDALKDEALAEGAEIVLIEDQTLNERLDISKDVTINGNGNTIDANDSISNTQLINVIGASVTLENVTLDCAGKAKGLQIYNNNVGENEEEVVTLKNVTILNSAGSGMTVNGSEVNATGLTIEGSAWNQSIDVSMGGRVTTPSELTLDSNSGLKDGMTIVEDKQATATVTVGGETLGARTIATWDSKASSFYSKYEFVAGAETGYDFVAPSEEEIGVDGALEYILSTITKAGATIQLTEGEYQAPDVKGTNAFTLSHPVSIIGAGEDETTIYGHIYINFDGGVGHQDYGDGSQYDIIFSDFTMVDDVADAQVAINTGSVNYARENYDFTVENVTFQNYLFGVQLASGYTNNTMAMNNVHFENIWCAASMKKTNELTMDGCTFENVTYQYQTWSTREDNAYYRVFDDEASKVDGNTVQMPTVNDWEEAETTYVNADGQTVMGTLEDAVKNAQADSTITLTKDVTLTAALTGFANGLTIEGGNNEVTVSDDVNYAINVPVDATKLTLQNITLEKDAKSGTAIKMPTGVDMTLNLTGCNINGFQFGIYNEADKEKNGNAVEANIVGCTFEGNYQKAIYVEALSNSRIYDCDFIDCGEQTEGASNFMGSAVDINLKRDSYSNITIEQCNFEGNGAGNGGALLIKARDDGSYADPAATLDGVTITGCTFDGNNKDIVFGEPMKNNAGPTNVTIDDVAVVPGVGMMPNVQEVNGIEVTDYRLAEGKNSVSFAGGSVGVVTDGEDFTITFDENTFSDAVTDFFCADCVADPDSDHADHETFMTVNSDGSLELEQAGDGRMPYFQLDDVDLENKTYTVSYDLNVEFTGEEDGVFGINAGNTGWMADAHFFMEQGVGLYNFAGTELVSEEDAYKNGGLFHVTVEYTMEDGAPKTILTITADGSADSVEIVGKGGTDKGSIYWCGYEFENVSANISNFTLTVE